MNATEFFVPAFIVNSDNPFLLHLGFKPPPTFRGLEVIDTLTPVIILNELRLGCLGAEVSQRLEPDGTWLIVRSFQPSMCEKGTY